MMNLREPIVSLITPHSSFIIPLEPFDETADALLYRRPRVVAEERPGLPRVGEGLRHVAGLRGLAVDARLAAQLTFEQADQLPELDRARLAEVDHFEARGLVVHRRAHARDDVVNVGVVAPRRAVAEDGDGTARGDEARELVYGEVWALARAVDGEEAQGYAPQAPEVRVGVAEQLARGLRRRVRADRPVDGVVLRERDFLVLAVDGRGRAEDELPHPVLARQLQKVERARDV